MSSQNIAKNRFDETLTGWHVLLYRKNFPPTDEKNMPTAFHLKLLICTWLWYNPF